MYKVTISEKHGFERVKLRYECYEDAARTVKNILDGDLENKYSATFEIEDSNDDVD